jgi:hypothetical protein
MARLARGEFGRLLFGPLLGGRKLCLERFYVGFEHANDLIGQRSLIRIAETLSVAIRPNSVIPALRRPDPRAFVIPERLLPTAALRPLANRLSRHAQQFGGLSVSKPLARQIVPRRFDVGPRRQRAAQQGL